MSRKQAIMILLRQLWKDELGTATVEYALLTAVLVGAGAAAWVGLRNCVSTAITDIADSFSEGGQ